ncbi:MAG: hypothetical protein KDA65_16550 [Planctomycetaceae bacterium]|nr:hypothetical protein [Planctomycetaceae bacterium]
MFKPIRRYSWHGVILYHMTVFPLYYLTIWLTARYQGNIVHLLNDYSSLPFFSFFTLIILITTLPSFDQGYEIDDRRIHLRGQSLQYGRFYLSIVRAALLSFVIYLCVECLLYLVFRELLNLNLWGWQIYLHPLLLKTREYSLFGVYVLTHFFYGPWYCARNVPIQFLDQELRRLGIEVPGYTFFPDDLPHEEAEIEGKTSEPIFEPEPHQ